MSHKWRFTRCNIDGYIAGNGARTPSHLNLHQSVHQRKRASTKNQIGVDSSVELTLAQYNNSNGGRWLYIVQVQQRTLSLVHKTHHLAPQQLTSLKPIRPTTVFTRIGFHQRVATVQCTQVIYIWVVLCCFLRDRELDKGRSNFSF